MRATATTEAAPARPPSRTREGKAGKGLQQPEDGGERGKKCAGERHNDDDDDHDDDDYDDDDEVLMGPS
eukprot:2483111-Pyramimonas_sp.AAC.1